MKKEPMQSIASSLKLLAGIQIIPAILLSLVLVYFTVDIFASKKRREAYEKRQAEQNKPIAYPIKMIGKPIPEEYNTINSVSLKFEGMSAPYNPRPVTLRLINPTEQPIVYLARDGVNPCHLIQTKKDGKWTDYELTWQFPSSFRKQTVCINPKESILITVQVDSDLFPIRIGMEFANATHSERTVWSAPIELDQFRE